MHLRTEIMIKEGAGVSKLHFLITIYVISFCYGAFDEVFAGLSIVYELSINICIYLIYVYVNTKCFVYKSAFL